jgi:hypothetical protein
MQTLPTWRISISSRLHFTPKHCCIGHAVRGPACKYQLDIEELEKYRGKNWKGESSTDKMGTAPGVDHSYMAVIF